MKKNLFNYCTLALALIGFSAKAQTYGTWVGANDAPNAAYFWEYNPVGTANTFNTATSAQDAVSTTALSPFLPVTPSGSARVFTPASSTGTGGGFSITSTALTQTAITGNTPVKFSAYGINGATTVTSLFFDIDFNSTTATNGIVILALGKYTNGNLFNNTNQLAGSSSAGVFGAIRLEFYGSNIQTYYRSSAFAYPTPGNTTLFSRSGGAKRVEIYANNSNVQQSYVRSSTIYNLPKQTFNVWVNGVLYTPSDIGTANIPATGELAAGEVIDAFAFNASNSTSPSANLVNFSLSNIKIGRIPLSVLPIKLANFTGKKVNNAVQLSFSTENEHDNAYFDILRSANGGTFNLLGRVTGSGNSTTTKNYSFTDFNPAVGTNYYKLRQTDKDGKSEDFDSIAIKFGLDNDNLAVRITENKLSLNYNSEQETQADLTIFDLNGKKIIAKKVALNKGANQPSVDVSFVPAGVYVLRFTENANTNTVKFVKK